MGISFSMVALAAPRFKGSFRAIQRTLAKHWPQLPPASDGKADKGTFAFRLGEASVVLGYMPAPIPWTDLEGPCATSVLWPKATEELKNHAAHLIVTVSGNFAPLEMSGLLTQATAAVMETCDDALGVFWCDATIVVPKGIFNKFAVRVLPLGPPLDIWVDYRIAKTAEQRSAGFTKGLAALGHMELEALSSPEPPHELRERFAGLARYLLENGPVIRDGDTIGEDAEERIRVAYADSSFGVEGEVMTLVYEKNSRAKPWRKLW